MKNLKYLVSAVCLAAAVFAQGEAADLPPFPGAEYAGAVRRTYRSVTPEDMAEGSPVWISLQLVACSLKGDFEPLKGIVSPSTLKSCQANTPKQVEALFGGFLMDDTVRIGDSKEDGNRYYVYLSFKRSDGRKRSYYTFFLKVNDRWINVTPAEWRFGELNPVK